MTMNRFSYFFLGTLLLLIPDSSSGKEEVSASHPFQTDQYTVGLFHFDNVEGMISVHASPDTVRQALAPVYAPAESQPVGDVFLVSPDGQIFMRYPTHENMDATLEEAENIRVDLKRTLKGSLIG